MHPSDPRLVSIYRKVRGLPLTDEGWLVFADALEEAGHRRLARRISRLVHRRRRLMNARRLRPADPYRSVKHTEAERYRGRIRIGILNQKEHKQIRWALDDVFGFA